MAGPPPNMPLSQWLLTGLPSTSAAASSAVGDLSGIVPTSSGLPAISPLGPSMYDMCSTEWIAIRQYAILAARATANDHIGLASDWVKYVLLSSEHPITQHHSKALEALLCCHIFAGIPRCIEALYTVRKAEAAFFKPLSLKVNTDGSQLSKKQHNNNKRLQRIKSELHIPVNTIDQFIDASAVTKAAAAVCQCNTKCECQQQQQQLSPVADVHSSAVRDYRGDIVLKAIYGDTYPMLQENMSSYHASLWQYIRQCVYGYQLSRCVLSVSEIECVAVAALTGINAPRQLYSHMRGSKFNGVTYELLLNILHDLRLVYAPDVIDTANVTLRKVYNVKEEATAAAAAAGEGDSDDWDDGEDEEIDIATLQRMMQQEDAAARKADSAATPTTTSASVAKSALENRGGQTDQSKVTAAVTAAVGAAAAAPVASATQTQHEDVDNVTAADKEARTKGMLSIMRMRDALQSAEERQTQQQQQYQRQPQQQQQQGQEHTQQLQARL